MIESIEFSNFKALRKVTLPLEPFTLLLGPNGSGKSTVLHGLVAVATVAADQTGPQRHPPARMEINRSAFCVTRADQTAPVEITLRMRWEGQLMTGVFQWVQEGGYRWHFSDESGRRLEQAESVPLLRWLARIHTYALDASAIEKPAMVSAEPLQPNGGGLAAVLDDLKDNHRERWESLLAEMRHWLPEYDYIEFEKPQPGTKGIQLQTQKGGHRIPAKDLSQGTLVALALLSLAYSLNPPPVVGLEEIDRGLHPRLLRHLQDALYRLGYPESCGETRPPIQVIATTHSPYLLDLFRDHPEEVVLAQKKGLEVEMTRLSDVAHFEEILGDAPLSEVWYSGVLGGVSVKS
jgi:predicted ATPase